MVRSDPLLLPPLVGNLLSNAVAHAPAGGQIVCRAEAVEGAAQLSILNSNDSIEESDLPHLFEPFWRKDSARTGSIHVGLGLTLVAAYAKMLGIEIKPRLRCEGMFEMILTIPLAGPSNGKCAGEEPDNSRRQVGRDAVVRA